MRWVKASPKTSWSRPSNFQCPGSSGPGADDATSAAATAVGKSVGEARLLGFAKHSASTETRSVSLLQSSQSLLRELGLLGVAKYRLRQNPDTQGLLVSFLLKLVKLGLLGLESTALR